MREETLDGLSMGVKSEKFPGLKLSYTLQGKVKSNYFIAWSPDGRSIAALSSLGIQIWDTQTKEPLQFFKKEETFFSGSIAWSPDSHFLAISGYTSSSIIERWDVRIGIPLQVTTSRSAWTRSVAWSPDGKMLATGHADGNIQLWDARTGYPLQKFFVDKSLIHSVAWSSDSQLLAAGYNDGVIRLWNIRTGELPLIFHGHNLAVLSLAWSPNEEQVLVSSSDDKTIRLWDIRKGKDIITLEGHTGSINSVSFSYDGRLLASQSSDKTIRIWRTSTWEAAGILGEPTARYEYPYNLPRGLAFHPTAPLLASTSDQEGCLNVWELDIDTIIAAAPATSSTHYANAKVVLVGDSGMGKSGLALALTDQPFVPTESTHGRHVWVFENQEVEISNHKETHETLLWDLAGQPGYRLIHQLHLNEVAVALIIFDVRSETDHPLAGIYHWDRALKLAQRVQYNIGVSMRKFLVAARIDRGGTGLGHERIDRLLHDLDFDNYFETSAKERWGVSELAAAIRNAIDWSALPKVSSTDLFQRIKTFLLSEKEAGRLLTTVEDLYRTFLRSENIFSSAEGLYAQFETCIGRLESRDLIRQLSFGNLVLLQPELLDSYASALINAVKEEPDGLGSIAEEKAHSGNFRIPSAERLVNREQEKLLLIAMVEDLLRHEIALREQANDGPYLVFPSQSTRENPDLSNPVGKAIIFDFEGPIQNVYATLVVRPSHSGLFSKKETWKDAVTYTTRQGGTYGISLSNVREGYGELTLFFDKETNEAIQFSFEDYVQAHLAHRAISETLRRRRVFVCIGCEEPFTDSQVKRRRELGFNWIRCNVCDTEISILDREELLADTHQSSVVQKMDSAANRQRDREAALSTLQGKIVTGDFDIFLSHNEKDKSEVKRIGEQLKERGILPWLDEWEVPPGRPWLPLVEQQIEKLKSAAVFVSKNDMGPWQKHELYAFLNMLVDRGCPVIPVLLPSASKEPELPIFLKGMTWVDFRKQDPNPLERLIWGITGKRLI